MARFVVMHSSGALRAVTVSFLLSSKEDPAVRAPGRGSRTLHAGLHARASCGVLMLDRQRAFFVPTLDPARCPLRVVCCIKPLGI